MLSMLIFAFEQFELWSAIILIACPIMQMLTSKDANFLGYTFKKSDIIKSVGTSGLLLPKLAIDFKYLIVYFIIWASHFGVFFSYQPGEQRTLSIVIWRHLKQKLHWPSMEKSDKKCIGMHAMEYWESSYGRKQM